MRRQERISVTLTLITACLACAVGLSVMAQTAESVETAGSLQEAAQMQARCAKADGVSVETSIDLPEGGKLQLVYVPKGEFMMGSREGLDYARPDERPQHLVVIGRAFCMGKFEVTQDQMWAVMRANPSLQRGGDLPVDRATWDQASEFCKVLTKTSGRRVRLPTEAEWEYACRAALGTQFPYCSNEIDRRKLYDFAWYYNPDGYQLRAVGQKRANAWGLHDMLGNVWEWCDDWYDADYYSNSPKTDPRGPATGTNKVARGGPWDFAGISCRAAYREKAPLDKAISGYGFRVVVELK